MPRRFSAALLLLSAAAAGAAEPCRPIVGLEPWLQPGRIVLLGEIHGTVESPAFAGDVACHAAAAGLEVVVALELLVAGQRRVDAFLDSDGGEDARRALLAGADWQRGYQDGRNSRAMLELIERLGRLRRAGAEIRVALFDVGTSAGGQARDRGMAERLAELTAEHPEALTVVLTGNLHSRTRRGRPGNADYQPMGHLLARATDAARLVALREAHGGGSAWVCNPECGVTRLGGRRGERPWEIEIGERPPPGHDGWYRLGAITASPPARLSEAEQEALRRKAVPPVAAAPAARPPDLPPVPAPDGPLSAAERSLQGRWQGFDFRRGYRTWTLEVDGRGFRAEGSGEWYEGRLVVRAERRPASVDFVIERCRCSYEGATSEAVFERDGESLLVAAAAPGSPRPAGLKAPGAQLMRFAPR